MQVAELKKVEKELGTFVEGFAPESDTPGLAGGLMSGAASKAVTRVC